MKGYIYAFVDNDTYEIYLGSTINEIKVRYGKHMTDLRMFLGLTKKGCRNYRTSFDVLYNNNYKVMCIHKFDVISKEDLKLFESLYIIKFKAQGLKLVNGCISNKSAKMYNYKNFGLKELDFTQPSLFEPSSLLKEHF